MTAPKNDSASLIKRMRVILSKQVLILAKVNTRDPDLALDLQRLTSALKVLDTIERHDAKDLDAALDAAPNELLERLAGISKPAPKKPQNAKKPPEKAPKGDHDE